LRALLVAAPSALRCDVLLGIDEAVANALSHADTRKTIAVHAAIDGGRVTVTISDSGRGFDVGALVRSWPPTREAESGRGIYLLATLMDVVTIDVKGGTIVHMSRELSGNGHRRCPPATALSATRARFDHRVSLGTA
jgi:anti-sigma regulatory factor (Ser/Thr protein kinase)